MQHVEHVIVDGDQVSKVHLARVKVALIRVSTGDAQYIIRSKLKKGEIRSGF
jgi:hypothetical protein